MKTDFIPIDYDYFDFHGRNHIKMIGRNSKGKRICIIDTCDVYLWAVLKKDLKEKKIKQVVKKIEKIKLDLRNRKTRVEKVELHEKNFGGKPVKALKIFATNYKDLHDIASKLDFKEIEKRRGYDLGFIKHYIIEKKIRPMQWYELEGEFADLEFQGIENLDVDFSLKLKSSKEIKEKPFSPRTLAYDIETDELEIGKGEILMISLVGKDFKKVITWKKPGGESARETKSSLAYVEYVKDEAELLEKFVSEVRTFSPDFLVGYFSDGFDLPYIKSRADKFGVDLKLGLDDRKPRFSRSGVGVSVGKIFGIVHIDLLRFIRTAYSQYMKSETLSLNEVAKEFLGDTKKSFKFEHSSNIQKNNQWEKYFEYNLHDSKLTLDLFEKFWPDLLEFTKIIREPVFDLSRAGLSKYVESYILHNLDKFNEIPEKRPTYSEIGSRRGTRKVEGAFVLEPKPGLYENVVMFDFTSMHTSIIISMNISKSTLLEKKPISKKGIASIETSMGKFYFSKKPGFIPLLLEDIFQKRKKAKAEYKKSPNKITLARSNTFKLLSASVHGYIGFFGARYYSIESSASILAFVRKFNQDAIKEIENQGFQVLYGDTDSIAFSRNKKTKKEIKDLLEDLNSKLPGNMELELEGFFKRGLWVTTRDGKIGAKKKYALLGEDGKIKIRGFETVRRDWCTLAREVQNKIILHVLKDGNSEKALEYLKKIIKKLKNREIPFEKIIIKTQLKKPISEYKSISPHVVAAKRMKELEIPVSTGNVIE